MRLRWPFAIYLGLLLASWIWTALPSPPEAALPSSASERPRSKSGESAEFDLSASLPEYGRPEDSDASVRIAYHTLGEPSREATLLLHGSPGSLQDFSRLAARIAADEFVVVPDMAGFGKSQKRVGDYSFIAQAHYMIALLDTLGIEKVHLVGFSWGGGVAIELAGLSPDRASSLVLVSALGVQELELLGHYELNRLVHRLLHGTLAVLDWVVPHFGRLRGWQGFSRSFLDSDQRRLRPLLEQWDGPLLIIHGREDFLVPAQAALEHARIVPQSRLEWIAGGHLVLWTDADQVYSFLHEWISGGASGRRRVRSEASLDRIAAARHPFDHRDAGPQDGLGWIVFGLLVFIASMVSEDLTCIGVGLLSAIGQVPFWGAVSACIVALVIGDLALYAGGRWIGARFLKWVSRSKSESKQSAGSPSRIGATAILLGRFVPGARLPTYVGAGIVAFPILPFLAVLTLAASLWAPLLVGAAAFGGQTMPGREVLSANGLPAILLLLVFLALAAKIVPRLSSFRGRRILLSKWKRFRRWEFWPIWAIYLFLLPSLLREAFRHRSIRLPTLVNPPIPGGGLAGESKGLLTTAINRSENHAIPTQLIEPGDQADRIQQVEQFAAHPEVGFPVVLKPDIGERGRGVAIVQDQAEITRYLDEYAGRLLAQKFIEGDEFGIFYVRDPKTGEGEIISLARKTARQVIGNGSDSLERLILEDPICLPVAELLLQENADDLHRTPAKGELVQVTQLGTHSLGCRFLIGEDLLTKALETAVDVLSREVGLDFGRFDVISTSEAELQRGSFRVVEFNGLTAEAAHAYDPSYGLFAGLSILSDQWQRAFEVGAAHRSAGRSPLSWHRLAELVQEARAPLS